MAKKASKESKDPKAEFLAAAKKGEKAWKKSRTAEPGDSFSQPELPDGNYDARITAARYGKTKAGDPYVSFNFKIVDGEYEGERPNKFYNLSDEQGMEYFVKDLKRLKIETEEMTMADVVEVCEQINEDQPGVSLNTKTKSVKNKKTKKMEDRLNVYIDKPIDIADEDDDEEEDDEEEEKSSKKGKGKKGKPAKSSKKSKKDEEEDEDDDEGEEEEDDDADEDEDEGEEEEEGESIPEKGDAVMWKAPKAKKAAEWTVVKVNEKKETVDLKGGKDGKDTHKGIPFSDVEIVFEEDDE